MNFKSLKEAMVSEINAMRSGFFIPYHKMSLMVAVLVTVIFSVVFSHGLVFEGQIKVVDLDNSQYSRDLVTAIDASSYISVKEVRFHRVDIPYLTLNDEALGVLYLPNGLEENILSGKNKTQVTYFADYSNEPQNAEIIENLNEIIATFSGQVSGQKVGASLGLNSSLAQNVVNPLQIKIRRLYNPTFSATNSTIIGFIHFFSALYLGLTTLMIIGRLRLSHRYEEEVLKCGPWELMARVVPYAFFYTVAISLMMSFLVFFGQMRFAGNFLYYVPSLFLTGLAIGLLALLYSWNAKEPGHGAAFMIFLIPPGFIMGGATMAVGVLPQWAYLGSHFSP